jgi:hypothetical protein
MPRNTPKSPQRRVNPDKAPWDSLPVIVFHPDPDYVETPMTPEDFNDMVAWLDEHRDDPVAPDRKAVIGNGTVTVVRGPFDIADLPAQCLSRLEQHPGVEHVVTTDGLGRIDVSRRGALVDIELLDIGEENMSYFEPLHLPNASSNGTLADYAEALRTHALRAYELAEKYEQLAAEGWDLAPEPPPGAWWPPLRRTPTGDTAQGES